MKREITFGNQIAMVERSKTAAMLEIPRANSDSLAILSDAIDENDGITVIAFYPNKGKVQIIADRTVSNTEVIDMICDAIGRVFDCDTRVNYACAEDSI